MQKSPTAATTDVGARPSGQAVQTGAPTFARQFHYNPLSGSPSAESQPQQSTYVGYALDPNGLKHMIHTGTTAATQQTLDDDGRRSTTSVINPSQSVACVVMVDPWDSPTAPGTATKPLPRRAAGPAHRGPHHYLRLRPRALSGHRLRRRLSIVAWRVLTAPLLK